jgi:D-alanyl-D-alanine carboxypeptidase (penicillin-binding protein 5/6)
MCIGPVNRLNELQGVLYSMLKKALSIVLSVIFVFVALPAMPAMALVVDEYVPATVNRVYENTDILNLKAKSAILIDGHTGTVLFEKSSSDKLPIASVTKIMSMLLIMEAIESNRLSYDTKVTVSEHSHSMGGSQVWLEPGEVFTVDELLKAVAIHSANDATVALGECIAGSEEAFVNMMNEKARKLGMNNTTFLDCTGLTDEGHYSSAFDIAIMSRELLLKHPDIINYTRIWHDSFRDNVPGKNAVSLDNTNKLIRWYDGATGLKTGFTNKAGYCLSASAERDGQMMISVVLGEPDSNTRFAESRKLLDYGFANFETALINNKGAKVDNIPIKKGLPDNVNAVYKDDVKILIKKGQKDQIESNINIAENLMAPVNAGDVVGVEIYFVEGKEVGKAEIVAEKDVSKATFGKVFIRLVHEWFTLGRSGYEDDAGRGQDNDASSIYFEN